MAWQRLAVVAMAVLAATDAGAAPPTAAEVLERLVPGHPRLIVDDADLRRIRETVDNDARAAQWLAEIERQAEKILAQPAVRYEIPDGKRLLATSRRVVDHAFTLGLLYRLTGDDRYRDRLWLDLDAAARFKDWNPSHFLDTAEMTAGFGIAYDWCYDGWSEAQRKTIRNAIVKQGLAPATEAYRRRAGWARSAYNWNQVCNGGLAVGALAIADEEPALAASVVANAVALVPLAIVSYEPDGGWAEGPGYWGYATQYTVAMIAALETALGTDFGISDTPGFRSCGDMPLHCTGPTGRTFNFADASESTPRYPEMLWLARRFDRPEWAEFHLRFAKPEALDLIWYDPRLLRTDGDAVPPISPLPLIRKFDGVQAATMRTVHDAPDALFVGFKAGRNGVNHGNLDIGSFILEALGVRWAIDLGRDNYNMPGYFGGKRWTYYRMRAEGHNTLLINPGDVTRRAGADQVADAYVPIADFDQRGDVAFVEADLTAAYEPDATHVRRRLELSANTATCSDEVDLREPGRVDWQMHTRADVDVAQDGKRATLRQGGKTLLVRLREGPPSARFAVRDARPLPSSPQPEGQHHNEGVRKLVIQLDDVATARLLVEFEPQNVAPASH